jgi:hypothetical protein
MVRPALVSPSDPANENLEENQNAVTNDECGCFGVCNRGRGKISLGGLLKQVALLSGADLGAE